MMRVLSRAVIWLITIYRRYISPLKPPCCRFTPTCSQYALEAFRTQGFLRATWLVAWRLLRCQPFYHGSLYDPVPERRAGQREKQ